MNEEIGRQNERATREQCGPCCGYPRIQIQLSGPSRSQPIFHVISCRYAVHIQPLHTLLYSLPITLHHFCFLFFSFFFTPFNTIEFM